MPVTQICLVLSNAVLLDRFTHLLLTSIHEPNMVKDRVMLSRAYHKDHSAVGQGDGDEKDVECLAKGLLFATMAPKEYSHG